MYKHISVILSLLFTVAFGCSKSPNELLVGKWEEVSDRQAGFEFFADGTCVVIFEGSTLNNIHVNWILLDDSHLKINFTTYAEESGSITDEIVESGSATNEISITDDRMLVTDQIENSTFEYIRIK